MSVRGSEIVDVRLSDGRTRELDVLTGAVRIDVETLPLEQEMGFHAPVLVRRAYHCVTELHLCLCENILQLMDSRFYKENGSVSAAVQLGISTRTALHNWNWIVRKGMGLFKFFIGLQTNRPNIELETNDLP